MIYKELIFIQSAIDKLKEVGIDGPYYLLQEDGTIEEIYERS